MPENNARKQIIAQIEKSENILIALSDNPSVDELASALALTLAINKSDKRATAVASGQMPDALEFLNPEKTFETSVDSLRDFIIALSKDKADHLKYKLVGDHVKIFITPYKSVISEKDLEFSQGDFNVDFVLALGVRDKDHLDAALAAHGRIFHDASVGVITVGDTPSTLSEINWHDNNASALSELVLDLIEQKPFDKKALNQSVATAILTGIVAETERFSNQKTTAKVMNTASKLILAGADQQLVISKIKEAEEKATRVNIKSQNEEKAPKKEVVAKIPKNGGLRIDHTSTLADLENSLKIEKNDESEIENLETSDAEKSLEDSLAQLAPEPQANAFKDLENFPSAAEIAAQRVETTETGVGQNSSDNLNFEESPITPTETQPQAEVSPENFQIEVPAKFEQNQLPSPESAPISEDFLTEAPIPAQDFEPAPIAPIEAPAQLEVSPEAITQTSTSQTLNQIPEASPSGQGSSRTILPLSSPEISANQPLNLNDEYYNPAQNQLIAQSLTAQPDTLSHQIPAGDAGTFPPPLPPMPDFSQMMPPSLPEIPDFGQLPELPAMPPVDFGVPMNSSPSEISTIPAPDANLAMGTAATQNQVMTENLYPDPSQFRIPGM
ncbi:MAG: hypothetical protein Q4A21_00170 [bacterium]|nr:hypothetical protein [bacterium]